MKRLIQWGILSSLLCAHLAFALNAAQGFYAGIFGEVSTGPAQYHLLLNQVLVNDTFVTNIAQVRNTRIGGGGGGMLGFRLCNFRGEAELFYNYNSANTLSLGSCTLSSPTANPFDVSNCVGEDRFIPNQTGFNGNTAGIFGFINAYYDFFPADSEGTFVPYLGIGVGGAQLQTRVNFVPTVLLPVSPSTGAKVSLKSSAAQGIIGFSIFLDDLTTVGMDYRYVTTGTIRNENSFLIDDNSRYNLHTLNFIISFVFDNCK